MTMITSSLTPVHPLVQLSAPPAVQHLAAPTFQGNLRGFELNSELFSRASGPVNLSQIHSGFLGSQDTSQGGIGGTLSMMAMLQAMIQTLTQWLATGQQLPGSNGSAGGNLLGAPSAGVSGAAPNFGMPANGNGSGSIVPSSGSAPVQAGQPAPASSGAGASPVKIGPGTKVLQIGDSHSVGAFGKELDAKLRGTGAQVSTYASAGATASTFVNGKSTKYGYWENKADGSSRTVGYGKSAQTPRLDQLIAKERPSVIVVNLGANFRGSNPKGQVDQLGQVAQKHGIPIVWVGPPKTAKDTSNPNSLAKFDQEMASAVAPYGKYISSNRHTPQYSGGDGIHYGGQKGTQLAKQWAGGVFSEIAG